MTALRFRVRGMDCAEEVGVLREALGALVGQGGDLAFDVLNGRMIITPGSGASDESTIIAAGRATGSRYAMCSNRRSHKAVTESSSLPKIVDTSRSKMAMKSRSSALEKP